MEEIAAALDVGDARLPVNIQQVHPLNGDVAQSVEPAAVPHDFVYPCACFQLLPHGIGVCVFKVVLLQNTGNDAAEHPRLPAVIGLSGQDPRCGIGIHHVGVLADDDVVEPAADGAEAAVCADVGGTLLLGGVAKLPPVFAGKDAPFGVHLAVFIFLQDAGKLLHLLTSDGKNGSLFLFVVFGFYDSHLILFVLIPL